MFLSQPTSTHHNSMPPGPTLVPVVIGFVFMKTDNTALHGHIHETFYRIFDCLVLPFSRWIDWTVDGWDQGGDNGKCFL